MLIEEEEEEEEEEEIVSLGDSRIERGGFENVLRDAGIRAIRLPTL